MDNMFVKPKLVSASVLNRNANGYFYNAPTLGADLVVNGTFAADANWTKGGGWTIAGGVGVGTAAGGTLSQSVLAIGGYYKVQYDLVSRSLGTVRAIAPTDIDQSALATYTVGGVAISLLAGIAPTTFTGTVDNISAKRYTHAEAFVLCNAGNPYSDIAAYIPGLPSVYAQFVIANCDSAVSPANYLHARLGYQADGSLVAALRKFVGGVQTSIIANTAVTFAANAPLEIRRLKHTDTYQLWYNNLQVGTNQTVTDANINGNVFYGIVGLDSTSLITDVRLNGITIF